jgi:hypothetical protein
MGPCDLRGSSRLPKGVRASQGASQPRPRHLGRRTRPQRANVRQARCSGNVLLGRMAERPRKARGGFPQMTCCASSGRDQDVTRGDARPGQRPAASAHPPCSHAMMARSCQPRHAINGASPENPQFFRAPSCGSLLATLHRSPEREFSRRRGGNTGAIRTRIPVRLERSFGAMACCGATYASPSTSSSRCRRQPTSPRPRRFTSPGGSLRKTGTPEHDRVGDVKM